MLEGEGCDVDQARAAVEELLASSAQGRPVDAAMVESLMDIAVSANGKPSEVYGDVVWTHRGRQIGPRTVNQKRYVDAIRAQHDHLRHRPRRHRQDLPGRWPWPCSALISKQVGRIILTRPAVEAGESLGFLPGTISEKVDPYLRPLFDALYDMIDAEQAGGAASRRARSRSRRWPSCAGARSTTRSSSSTRRRTPRPSR